LSGPSGPRKDSAGAAARPASATRTAPAGAGTRLAAWRRHHAHSLVASLGRFLHRPLATLLTVGVMALALALPLGLALGVANLERLAGQWAPTQAIAVFLRPDIDAAGAARLAETVRARSDVAGVQVQTPEEGLAEFRRLTDTAEALALLDANPLPSVLQVQPRPEAGDATALATALRALPEAEVVQHDAAWRRRLEAWLDFARRFAAVLAALLAAGALGVVFNTVRLEIGARRDEIEVLQQLGATDAFVRRPFVYLGAWYGSVAGAAALALLVLAGLALRAPLARLADSYGSGFALAGPNGVQTVAVLLGATVLGALGAWLATGHHLRQTRPTDL
jgi:cell division transport system permease protein